jgi:hypothetical protein
VDRNLLYLVISLAAVWFILDDFYGAQRISGMVNTLVSGNGAATKPDTQLTPLPPTAGDPLPLNPNLTNAPAKRTPPSVPAATKAKTAFLGKPWVII